MEMKQTGKVDPFRGFPELSAAERTLDVLLQAVRTLEERGNGEAEARSHLAGQFHEALVELVEFAKNAHAVIELNEANTFALTKQLGRLTDLVEQHVRYSDERMDAISTALQAVWDVTKPRPSIWGRLFR